MSLSVQQLLSDARKLTTKLKDYDLKTDQLMAQTQTLNKCVETMKEYHEDMTGMSRAVSSPSCASSRSAIIVTIQRESKQLRKLELENRELKCALEDYQFVLELIMSKYRHQTSQLLKVEKAEMGCLNMERDNCKDVVNRMTNQICEMAFVMNKSIQIDEDNAHKEQQLLAQLKLENKALRELLKIARNYESLNQSSDNKT